MFDREAGIRGREEGMARAERGASVEFKEAALHAVKCCAEAHPCFTTDLVWCVLNDDTSERRAMGPIMRRAEKAGYIQRTDRTAPSDRPEAHRNPKRVWKSNLFKERALQ